MNDDLISRQAAIDAARKCPIKEVTPAYMLIDKAEVMTELMMLPAAQPEIIRCKDCKHRPLDGEDTQGSGIEFPDEICPCQCEDFWYSWRPDDDWFCANADMRGEEDV